jgi:hypothetical protein
MTQDIERLKDDIAFIKGLAKDDGSVLFASGVGLAVGGIVFGLMILRSFLISIGWLEWPAPLRPFMSFDAVVLFFAIFIAIAMRFGKRPRQTAVGATSRAMWASWAAVGVGYLSAQIALSAAGVGDLAGITLFAFWGGGWVVVWAIYRQAGFALVALACYATAIGAGLLWGTPYRTLLLAIGFFVLIALPGAAVIRRARASA